ncbi:MAG: hypothetical protein KPI85_06940 [cyanobacterium endosymbiont of Epithemia adnata isolate EadnSB Bon19]
MDGLVKTEIGSQSKFCIRNSGIFSVFWRSPAAETPGINPVDVNPKM